MIHLATSGSVMTPNQNKTKIDICTMYATQILSNK